MKSNDHCAIIDSAENTDRKRGHEMKCVTVENNMKPLKNMIDRTDIEWYDVRKAPFAIHGLYRPDVPGCFRRLPEDVARATSSDVEVLARNTAGGRIRFATDSAFVAIHAQMPEPVLYNHMTYTNFCGFDMYIKRDEKTIFKGAFRPPVDMKDGFESLIEMPDGKWTVEINMPAYGCVNALWIGFQKGCAVEKAEPYRIPLPVVYYGSSITQGGCASRPGNGYVAMITRMLDCDHINLGFSGSGKAEPAICKYMAEMEMSAFVCDYDHNAPDVEYLQATHERLYRTIREKHPRTPILLVSKPDVLWKEDDSNARRAVILETYRRAMESGDENVAFIDGSKMFDGLSYDDCTVDGCHPNDLGMYRMAVTIGSELAKRLM